MRSLTPGGLLPCCPWSFLKFLLVVIRSKKLIHCQSCIHMIAIPWKEVDVAAAVYSLTGRRWTLKILPNSWPRGVLKVAVEMILWKATNSLDALLNNMPGLEDFLQSSDCWRNFFATLWMLGSGLFFPSSLITKLSSVWPTPGQLSTAGRKLVSMHKRHPPSVEVSSICRKSVKNAVNSVAAAISW